MLHLIVVTFKNVMITIMFNISLSQVAAMLKPGLRIWIRVFFEGQIRYFLTTGPGSGSSQAGSATLQLEHENPYPRLHLCLIPRLLNILLETILLKGS